MGKLQSVAIAIAIVLFAVWGFLNLLIGFAFVFDASMADRSGLFRNERRYLLRSSQALD